MTDRKELLRLLRVRPDWLADDEPDDKNNGYWEVPEAIAQRYYDGGAEVDMPALVEFILASDWLARVKREAKAEALDDAAVTFQGDTYTGPEVAARLRARATTYREQVKP